LTFERLMKSLKEINIQYYNKLKYLPVSEKQAGLLC